MTNALQHMPSTAKRLKSMSKERMLHRKVHEEMAKFEKAMEELHLLKRVSQDLKNYRKMIRLKRYD
jgi:division protein CdvB (Snf7/Vps24/ESCRT-III family)